MLKVLLVNLIRPPLMSKDLLLPSSNGTDFDLGLIAKVWVSLKIFQTC